MTTIDYRQGLATFPYALSGWFFVTIIISQFSERGGFVFVFTHYLSILVIFGLLYRTYFRRFPDVHVFEMTVATMLWLFFFEVVNRLVFAPLVYDYLHWMLPHFLIATTVYMVGTLHKTY